MSEPGGNEFQQPVEQEAESPQAKLEKYLNGDTPGTIKFDAISDHVAYASAENTMKYRELTPQTGAQQYIDDLANISMLAQIGETIRTRRNGKDAKEYRQAYKEAEEVTAAYATASKTSVGHGEEVRALQEGLQHVQTDLDTIVEK